MRKTFVLLAAAMLTLTACDRSKEELQKQIAQVTLISAEKDSLLKDVMATQQFIGDVNAELARVKNPKIGKPTVGGGSELENPSPAEQRARILARVEQLTAHMNEVEGRLAASRERVKQLTGDNASLATQLAKYDSTITAFRGIIENQKAEIATLNEQVNALQGENKQLKADKETLTVEKTTLTGEKAVLTTERNTVYYVIGSKDELRKKGIIVKRGGILGVGASDMPATSLNPVDFTAIDKTQVMELQLPRADKTYRVLSRQDLGAAEPAPKGGFAATLKITNVEQFWAASKFLIIVQN